MKANKGKENSLEDENKFNATRNEIAKLQFIFKLSVLHTTYLLTF